MIIHARTGHELSHYTTTKEPLVSLYEQRYRDGLDLYTGEPLTTEQRQFAAKCFNCGEYFWSLQEFRHVQICSQRCKYEWSKCHLIRYVSTNRKKAQILRAIRDIGQPSRAMAIAEKILAARNTWADEYKADGRTVQVSNALFTVLREMVANGMLTKDGADKRAAKYAIP